MDRTAHSWRETFRVFAHPRVLTMLMLGFSAGIPLSLVFQTLTAWLAQADVERSTIGLISWVGTAYTIKFLWSPFVDRLPIPLLTRAFGQRRSWLLLSQAVIVTGLLFMSTSDPATALGVLVAFAVMVAFGSATQDIVIDAYRIDSVDVDYQGAMITAYIYGYRLALLAATAGAFLIADNYSWSIAYVVMACCMLVGIVTTLVISEPERVISEHTLEVERRLQALLADGVKKISVMQRVAAWFASAVVSPFVEFFARNRWNALAILALISMYLISDYVLGVMANPLYIDLGFSLSEIAYVGKTFGFAVTLVGAGLGGLLVVRYGIMRMLLIGAFLIAATNLTFAWLATGGAEIWRLAVVISADNLSAGIASAAFIAYMSGLANKAYTATQYALFTSLMKLPGKFVGGFSGFAVESYGYVGFFIIASAIGVPVIFLVMYITHVDPIESKPGKQTGNELKQS
jgi:PAT family beta-lactamase induction signal transducer AmpG